MFSRPEDGPQLGQRRGHVALALARREAAQRVEHGAEARLRWPVEHKDRHLEATHRAEALREKRRGLSQRRGRGRGRMGA